MASELNITIDQGATWTKRLTWQNSDGEPYDLTSHTALMQIRKDFADDDKSDPIIDLDEENGIVLGSEENNVVITLTATQTAAIPHGTYRYDVNVANNGEVSRLLRGYCFVVGAVSR